MRVADRFLIFCLIFLSDPLLTAQTHPPERKISKLAEGVYEIQHRDALPDFPQGNTTVVIGERSVFVVDSAYLPSSAREDIAQIRQWTNKPVRYLMLTHGHTDHVTGTGIYAREFPGITIIAHRETRNLIARYTPGYPDLFLEYTEELRKKLSSGLDDAQKPLTADAASKLSLEIRARESIADDVKSMGDNPLPDLTFDHDGFSLDLGNRQVEVLFLGRGNTAGDVVAFLPKERIAIVGDILVQPIPYTCSGFPVDWASTLDKIAELRPEVIIPGHGEPMHDLQYLHDVRDLLTSVIKQVNAIFQQIPGGGQSSLDRAQKTVDVSAFRGKFPSGDQYNPDFFGRSVPNCLVRNTYYQLAPR
jgi:glyoxylase-like metal-dependent hydrolase (beta-lactamase superfamily II)